MSTPPPWGDTQLPWTIGQVKHLGSVTLGKMLQTKDAGQDVLAPYMRAANVQPEGVLALDDVKKMWFSPWELDDLTLRQGDVVVVEGGQGGFGRAAYIGEDLDGWGFQNSINRVRSKAGNDGRFLAYYLIALRATGFIRRYCNVVSMPHLTAEKLAAIPLPLPSVHEQRAIADYLDRETAEIDSLIAALERFIGLLQERRQAVIGHAFQGLPRSRTQLRRYIQFLTSGSRGWGDYYADEGDVFVRIGNLPRQSLDLGGEIQRVDLPPHVREGQRTRLRENDLLFSITAYIGSVALVGPGWVDAYVSQHVALCRLDLSRMNPRFVGYFMLGTEGQDQLLQGAVGGTKVQLALDDIRGLRIPAPALPEQRRIVAHLECETAKIDKLIAKTRRHIELARERKSALITAAVTGQIDITKGA
ncbi:restriction endonuclease subunit S [Streptomyces sp. YIM B13502]|uniref:restriction endonuclease subunit S n=1 Tax=Streptomyces sp. YIM B13502 TaxID=3366317 RepID=UPI00368D3130